ncbi:hypothetical protein Kisp01_59280 [Kineosporia sp. NBRC 101677]|uniref:PAS domain-containing sensor histidine kinase n=1 Tax=Kineosporia sp. NBRC 101677 TaxID=3032197 RepID=UPI0024A196E4|nr:PAS domain S-box protein [Kineosporia sp. NBRC 101677]GLY18914.1 hypothetical protein Kisp01_59280 [Kineosporia sp. NBRC 101677]
MEESPRSSQGEEPVVGAFAVPEPRGDDGIEIGLAGLLEVAPDAMVVIDGDGRIVAFNAKLTKLFGYDSNALRGQAIEALIPERLHAGHVLLRQQYMAAPVARPMGREQELPARRCDGSEFPVEISLAPLPGLAGTPTPGGNVIAAVRDASERVRTGRRISRFLDAAPDAMIVTDRDGLIQLANAQTLALFGYSADELRGQPVEILVPPESRADHPRRRASFTDSPTTRPMGSGLELEGIRKDGSRVPVEISLASVEDEGDLLVICTVRDISERRLADADRAHLVALVSSARQGLLTLDLTGEITSWNAGAQEIFGFSAADMVGRSWTVLDSPEQSEDSSGTVARILAGEQLHPLDTARRDRHGQDVEVSISLALIQDRHGRPAGVSVVIEDIAERKRDERELIAAKAAAEATNQELEAFSYAVAHDLRAPLRGIDGFAQALVEDYGDVLDDVGQEYLGQVRTSSQYMASLIDSLLLLSKLSRQELCPVAVDLSALAAQSIQRLRAADPQRQVQVEIQHGLLALADSGLMSVVLDNLLGNAWKYAAGGQDARIEFKATEERGVPCYVVRDNGVGFDMAYAGKLFGVFQRLHPISAFEGLGIGLATTQRIISRHGGRIWAQGEVGKGASFYFSLPMKESHHV